MCWTTLFSSAVIAEQQLSCTWREGLELDFDLMVQLSAVDNHLWLDDKSESITKSSAGGYIAVGFFNALIPVKKHPVQGIQWHLEFTNDEPISLAKLSAKHDGRVPIESIEEATNSKCFLGWCQEANILLGTA